MIAAVERGIYADQLLLVHRRLAQQNTSLAAGGAS
jgi:hypothetical protein